MANLNLKFLRGLQASLPTTGTDGYFYLTTDTHRLYTSIDGKVVPVNEGVTTVANLDALASVTDAKAGDFFYCTEENILTVFNGQNFVQINPDTGATSVEVVGEGNAVTAASYDAATRKLTLTKGETFALPADISNAVGELGDYDNVKAYVDAKTSGIAADADLSALAERVTTAEEEIDALQEDSHTHTFVDSDVEDAIAKKHAHTFVDSDVLDAIAKKHSHANAAELDKIVEGDKAKWDAVAADHLTSADKTALENSIKEAKKAGTDANTNIETYKVTNDARVLAVEEDIAEITNADNGILAQAKAYSDGKLATARTEVSAEIDADVKVVNDALEAYKSANDTALAGVKATAEAAATKEYTDAELAKKVDKVEGKSLVADTEIAKLAGVSEGANKVEASTTNGHIKIDGVETVVYTHPAKHAIADIEGLQDALDGKQSGGSYAEENHVHTKDQITDFAHTHIASEITDLDATIKGYDYATKDELGNVDAKFANYKTAEAQKAIDDEQDRRLGVIEGDYLRAADIANFETKENVKKVADDLAAYKTANDAALAAETKARTDADADFETRIAALEGNFGDGTGTVEEQIASAVKVEKDRAEGIEAGLRTDVDAIKADYLKAADKTELQNQITANANAITALTDGIDPDKIDGLTDLVNWANTHAPEVEGIKNDIEANAKAISDEAARADEAEKALAGRLDTLEAIDHDAYKAADATLKSELQAEIDADVKALADGQVAVNTQAIADEKTRAEGVEAELATAIEDAKTAASNQDAAVLAEAQKGIDALAQTVADNATAAGNAVAELEEKVYTKTEVEALIQQAAQWGEF